MTTQQSHHKVITILSLFMVILLDVMGIVLVFPVLTPLILIHTSQLLSAETSDATRNFYYGLTISLFPLFMFFSAPMLGDLSDRFGRKTILLGCLLATGLSYAVSAIAIIDNNFILFLLSRVIAGLAAGTQPIAAAGILDLSAPEEKTRRMSWIVFACSIGVVIGPLIGGVTAEVTLVPWFSPMIPFVFAGLLSLLNAVLLAFAFKETMVKKTEGVIQFSKGFVLFIKAFLEKKFRLLALLISAFILAWSFYFQAIGIFFTHEFGYSVAKLGLFTGFIGLVFALTTSVFSKIFLRVVKKETNAYLFFIAVMFIANVAAALCLDNQLAQWLWVIPNALCNVMCYTLAMAIFSNLAGPEAQGWVMGALGSIGAINWAVAGLLVGPIANIAPVAPLWVAALLCFVSLVLMLVYRRAQVA